jgi:hypothetical protein
MQTTAGIPEGEGPLGTPRRTLGDNIKMHLIEWIALIQFSIESIGGLLWTQQ